MMNRLILGAVLMGLTVFADAVDGEGLIKRVEFVSQSFVPHPDIVQFKIEGSFTHSDCDNTWAGIRKNDNHLISALLTARTADQTVQVYLDSYVQ